MAVNQDLDWHRELRASGLASVFAGLGGGTVASLIVPASLCSKRFGAATRLTGVVAALLIVSALFMGDGMLVTLEFFAVRLSRVDPIESRFTVRERRSTKARSDPDQAILLEEDERMIAYRLRG